MKGKKKEIVIYKTLADHLSPLDKKYMRPKHSLIDEYIDTKANKLRDSPIKEREREREKEEQVCFDNKNSRYTVFDQDLLYNKLKDIKTINEKSKTEAFSLNINNLNEEIILNEIEDVTEYKFPKDSRVDRWLRPINIVKEIKLHNELSRCFNGFDLYKNKQKVREYFNESEKRFFSNQSPNESFFIDYEIRKIISNLTPFYNTPIKSAVSPINNHTNTENKQEGFLFFTIIKVDMKLRSEEEINEMYKTLEQEFLIYLEKNTLAESKINGNRNSKLASPVKRKNKNDEVRNLREEYDDHFQKLYEKVKSPCVELNPGKLTYSNNQSPTFRWIASVIQAILDLNIRDVFTDKQIFFNIFPQKNDLSELKPNFEFRLLNNFLLNPGKKYLNTLIAELSSNFPIYHNKGVYIVILYHEGERIIVEINDLFPFDDLLGDNVFPACEAVSPYNPLGDLYPLLITKAIMKVLQPALKYSESFCLANDINLVYMICGYLGENIIISSNIFNTYLNFLSIPNNENENKINEVEEYLKCAFKYINSYLTLSNIDDRNFFFLGYKSNTTILKLIAHENSFARKLEKFSTDSIDKNAPISNKSKVQVTENTRRRSSIFSDKSLNKFYLNRRMNSNNNLIAVNNSNDNESKEFIKKEKINDKADDKNELEKDLKSHSIMKVLNIKPIINLHTEKINTVIKSSINIPSTNFDKSNSIASKSNFKELLNKSKQTNLTVDKETTKNNNNTVTQKKKLISSNYLGKISENDVVKPYHSKEVPKNITDQVVYSIPEVFHNFSFNMNRLKPMDFSDLKYILNDVKNINYKVMTKKEKKEYLDRIQDSRKLFKQKKQERLNGLMMDGKKVFVIRIKNSLVGLNSNYSLFHKLDFNDQEIKLASYCVTNFWKQPPPEYLEKMLNIQKLNQFTMDAYDILSIGTNLNVNATSEYMAQFAKDLLSTEGDFSHLSSLRLSCHKSFGKTKSGKFVIKLNQKEAEINIKKLERIPQGGLWVNLCEYLTHFTHLIKLINPSMYSNEYKTQFNDTSSKNDNRIVYLVNSSSDTKTIYNLIEEEYRKERKQMEEEANLDNISLNPTEANYYMDSSMNRTSPSSKNKNKNKLTKKNTKPEKSLKQQISLEKADDRSMNNNFNLNPVESIVVNFTTSFKNNFDSKLSNENYVDIVIYKVEVSNSSEEKGNKKYKLTNISADFNSDLLVGKIRTDFYLNPPKIKTKEIFNTDSSSNSDNDSKIKPNIEPSIIMKGVNTNKEIKLHTEHEYIIIVNSCVYEGTNSQLRLSTNLEALKIPYCKFLKYFKNYHHFNFKFSMIPNYSDLLILGKIKLKSENVEYAITSTAVEANTINKDTKTGKDNTERLKLLKAKTKSMFKNRASLSMIKGLKIYDGIVSLNEKEKSNDISDSLLQIKLNEASFKSQDKSNDQSKSKSKFNIRKEKKKQFSNNDSNCICLDIQTLNKEGLTGNDLKIVNMNQLFDIELIDNDKLSNFSIEILEELQIENKDEHFIVISVNPKKLNSILQIENESEINIKNFYSSRFVYVNLYSKLKIDACKIEFPYVFKLTENTIINPKKSNILIKDSLHVSF